jgi:hypothetical protein
MQIFEKQRSPGLSSSYRVGKVCGLPSKRTQLEFSRQKMQLIFMAVSEKEGAKCLKSSKLRSLWTQAKYNLKTMSLCLSAGLLALRVAP